MRRILAALAFLAALGVPATVRGQDPATASLYARALQHFNPRLDHATAIRLAGTTIDRADAYGLDARLLVALIEIESGWNPSAVSPAGARGLGQLMPDTAAELGVDADDPVENIDGAARYLRALLDRFAGRDPQTQSILALAAYNAGAGAVVRYDGVPPFPETRDYVVRVVRLWRRLAGE